MAKGAILEQTSLKDNSLTHCLSSACAGLVGAICGTPADVVKARVMNQSTDRQGRGTVYRSSVHCLLLTVKGEGLLGAARGTGHILLKDLFQRYTRGSCPAGSAWLPGLSHSGFHSSRSGNTPGRRPGDPCLHWCSRSPAAIVFRG